MPRSDPADNVALSDTTGKPCLQRLLQIELFGLFIALFALQRINGRFQHLARAVVPSARHQPLGQIVETL